MHDLILQTWLMGAFNLSGTDVLKSEYVSLKFRSNFYRVNQELSNRPFSYSTKESGSSDIFIHFYTQNSIEWRWGFYRYCPHSKILQNVSKRRSIEVLFQNS